MTEPAMYMGHPVGAPVADRDFGEHQDLIPIGGGLTLAAGCSSVVARIVAAETGDRVTWPFLTVGVLDGERRCIAVVLHRGAGVPGEVELSLMDCDLPITRRALRAFVIALFVEAGQDRIFVRVPTSDDTKQWALRRLGFRPAGRNDRSGSASRVIFSLDAETAVVRAFPRGIYTRRAS